MNTPRSNAIHSRHDPISSGEHTERLGWRDLAAILIVASALAALATGCVVSEGIDMTSPAVTTTGSLH